MALGTAFSATYQMYSSATFLLSSEISSVGLGEIKHQLCSVGLDQIHHCKLTALKTDSPTV